MYVGKASRSLKHQHISGDNSSTRHKENHSVQRHFYECSLCISSLWFCGILKIKYGLKDVSSGFIRWTLHNLLHYCSSLMFCSHLFC